MSGLKSDFNTVKGFVKTPLLPIPGLPMISTIGSQVTIQFRGTVSQPAISTIGSQATVRKPPVSALASMLKSWAF